VPRIDDIQPGASTLPEHITPDPAFNDFL